MALQKAEMERNTDAKAHRARSARKATTRETFVEDIDKRKRTVGIERRTHRNRESALACMLEDQSVSLLLGI